MIRTQIQLPEEEYEELRKLAAQERRSMADCIREGIRMFLRSKRQRASSLADIAGAYRPRSVDDLKEHDRQLADAIAESKRPEASR